jgi:hypothetical protein
VPIGVNQTPRELFRTNSELSSIIANNEIITPWRERINQKSIRQRHHAMDKVRRNDEAASGAKSGRDTLNGDVKCPLRHIAYLRMRVRMECAYRTLIEAEGDQHYLRPLAQHGAAVSRANLSPDDIGRQ